MHPSTLPVGHIPHPRGDAQRILYAFSRFLLKISTSETGTRIATLKL